MGKKATLQQMKHLENTFMLSTGQSWEACIVLFCLASSKASDKPGRVCRREQVNETLRLCSAAKRKERPSHISLAYYASSALGGEGNVLLEGAVERNSVFQMQRRLQKHVNRVAKCSGQSAQAAQIPECGMNRPMLIKALPKLAALNDTAS